MVAKREAEELLMIEEADAWFEYLEATRSQSETPLPRDRAVGLGPPLAAPARDQGPPRAAPASGCVEAREPEAEPRGLAERTRAAVRDALLCIQPVQGPDRGADVRALGARSRRRSSRRSPAAARRRPHRDRRPARAAARAGPRSAGARQVAPGSRRRPRRCRSCGRRWRRAAGRTDAEQRHTCGERREPVAQTRRDRARDGARAESPRRRRPRRRRSRARTGPRCPGAGKRDGDRRDARATASGERRHVVVARLAGEDVHVDIGAARAAEPHRSGLRTAAQELLPQLARARSLAPPTGEEALAWSRVDLPQQLPDAPRPRPEGRISVGASSATRGRARGSRAARPSPRGSRSSTSRRR